MMIQHECLTCSYRMLRSINIDSLQQTILLIAIVGLALTVYPHQVLTRFWGQVFHLAVMVETLCG